MLSHIVASIGLFIGIAYSLAIGIRVPYMKEKGMRITGGVVFLAALGWTMFIAAMWVF